MIEIIALLLFLILLCLLPRAFWKGLGELILIGFVFYLLSEHPGLSPTAWPWADILETIMGSAMVIAVIGGLAVLILKIGRLIPRPRRATPRQTPTRIEPRFDIPRRASDGVLAPPGLPPRRDAPPRL
jgi:hypothetical protein